MPVPIATALISAGAALLGVVAALIGERLRSRAARQQVRDENQREALIACMDAAADWREALRALPWWEPGDSDEYSRELDRLKARATIAELNFSKVRPRIRSPEVREAAARFATESAKYAGLRNRGPALEPIYSWQLLMRAVEVELQRVPWKEISARMRRNGGLAAYIH